MIKTLPNKAYTRSPATPALAGGARENAGVTLAPHCAWCSAGVVVGLLLCSVRVFRQFVWLEAGSDKVVSSRLTHQYPYGA
jgi:hypothetical protein